MLPETLLKPWKPINNLVNSCLAFSFLAHMATRQRFALSLLSYFKFSPLEEQVSTLSNALHFTGAHSCQ